MPAPRWSKVFHDLWAGKTRTILAVLSIAVGVFAVGLIGVSYEMMTRDLNRAYLAVNPASAQIYTDGFDENLVQTIARMPGVADAEGRRGVTMRIRYDGGDWRSINLTAVKDIDQLRMNRITPVRGAWPPPERTLLVERSGLSVMPLDVGKAVEIQMPDGRVRALAVSGVVHDISTWPAFFSGSVSGYMTLETAEWLGLTPFYTSLTITVDGDRFDKAHIQRIAETVRAKIESSGRAVYFTYVPPPGESPVNAPLVTMSLVLTFMGALLIVLSGFLVTNTVTALLMQQTRQIGVMKAIGATRFDVLVMYLAFVMALGTLAFLIAAPLGAFAGYIISIGAARRFNFDIEGFRLIPWVIVLQAIVSLLAPLAASLAPVFGGTRVTVREAIASYGLGKGHFGQSRIDRILERIRFLSRPVLLSLRNTFRRKGRLALTLVTLTLGGTIFVAVFTVQDSLERTLGDVMNYFGEDVRVNFGRGYRDDQIAAVVRRTPGVVGFEHWAFIGTRRMRPNGSESASITIMAPPHGSPLLRPKVAAGRWLSPDDENALVIETALLKEEPDLGVGATIALKINDRDTEWRVVGIIPSLGNGDSYIAYANYDYTAEIARSVGYTGNVRVVTARHDPAFQQQVAKELEIRFEAAGMRVSQIQTNTAFRDQIQGQFAIIVWFLGVMAALTTLVGGLGLMGTMSMNVIERTREIGVLRAIGASTGAIMRIVVVEGMVIGLVSWALAVLLSLPLSRMFSDAIGIAFLRSPLNYVYSIGGAGYWLALVIGLGALASILPAWNASRLTVRDVLAYEG